MIESFEPGSHATFTHSACRGDAASRAAAVLALGGSERSPCWLDGETAGNATSPADEHMAHMSPGDVALPAVSPSNQQGDLSLPPSARTAAARLAATPRHAEWVKVAWEPGSKDSIMAWIVYPKTSNAKTPVVVVVHEIFGLSPWIRGVADQVAAEGFIAIAPDLVSKLRGGPSMDTLSSDSARKLTTSLPIADRNMGIAAIAKYA